MTTKKEYKILFLTRYGTLGASSRLRTIQYIPFLEAEGFSCTVSPFFTNKQLKLKYSTKKHNVTGILGSIKTRVTYLLQKKKFDIIWIEKEALPWMPFWLERLLLKKSCYVLDYDDAIFHAYDQHRLFIVRYLFSDRIDKLMSNASLIITGNEYLSERARLAKPKNIINVPTVIDLKRYAHSEKKIDSEKTVRIVWIGSPSTVKHLKSITKSLSKLSLKYDFILRLIGGGVITMPNVRLECLDWTEETEAELVHECDIGIMPLYDSPWERGKCGYKLIQCMATGLPVVASNVGGNSTIVENGVNGYLANNSADWEKSLSLLLDNHNNRNQMGKKARLVVEERYCLQKTNITIIKALKKLYTELKLNE